MSTWNPNGSDSDSDSEFEDLENATPYRGREAFIYIIDAFLFETPELFQECLDLIRTAFLSGILTRDKDLIGLVLNNTKYSPEPKDNSCMTNIQVAENTCVFLPLRELTKDIVQYYMNFSMPDYFDFANKYGVQQANFASTMRLCSNMFQQCGHKLSSMAISYFTNRNSPHDQSLPEFQKALVKARDLEQMDIDFNVIPLEDGFDYSIFYKEFICMVRSIDLDSFVNPDPEQDRKLITNRQLRQDFQKRCQFHLNWDFGSDVKISVGMFNYYKKNVYPKSVKLFRSDNSIVKSKRVYKIGTIDPVLNCTSNERYLKPGDEKKVITVGGQRVDFNCEEAARYRSPIAPGLRLLGFVDNSLISVHDHIKSSSFLYPDDAGYSGSVKFFRALWQRCLARGKVPICLLVSRRKSVPKFVALVPTEHKIESKLGILQNDGFRVVFLPFGDNYRKLDLSEWKTTNPSEEGIELFQDIIKKLKMKFSPTSVRYPSLELLQENIIGLAFDVETQGAAEGGMPNAALQDERISAQLEKIVEVFGNDLEIAPKRKAKDPAGPAKAKVAKLTDDQINNETVGALVAQGALNSLTVKQLKIYLEQNNVEISAKATKAALIEKIQELNV